MSTPVWDKLHLRLAAGARDAVATAATDGKDYVVADRDNYLNAGYIKYILLLFNLYKNSPEILRSPLQSMVKHFSATVVDGEVTSTFPSDYGLFISISEEGDDRQSLNAVHRLSHEDFYALKNQVVAEIESTMYSQSCLPTDTTISILPSTANGTYDVVYISKPVSITEGGSVDFSLGEEHFDVILDFALWYLYKDKQEFAIAESYLKDGYTTAPFQLASKQ
jgi:hypothetical protein